MTISTKQVLQHLKGSLCRSTNKTLAEEDDRSLLGAKGRKDKNKKFKTVKDNNRNPTGESIFLYQPKTFLIIGSLKEFGTEHGVNEDKYSSFELFRRNLTIPEIITFDELYERARYIVGSSELNG